MAGFHHVELWVEDLAEASAEWGWLMARLGFESFGQWSTGQSWAAGGAYLTITTSPNRADGPHDRRRTGVNHLAFHGGSTTAVDSIMATAAEHGWTPLYQERYPNAGGPEHYAGWLENSAGFKAEIVADRELGSRL
ncbi:VOC family protein [Humidisolicoccus flavus]|uniref:VOC family protein n=1 Tax=Humidisolicoccus flavus TaxID=3111414 RepID=UPI003253ADD6